MLGAWNGYFQKRFGSDVHLLIFATRFETGYPSTLCIGQVLYTADTQIPPKSRQGTGQRTLKKARENFGVNNTRCIFAVRSKSFCAFGISQKFSPAQKTTIMGLLPLACGRRLLIRSFKYCTLFSHLL
jgi:hypothetical protein